MSLHTSRPPTIRHPLKLARGLGSAKGGTDHFLASRVTAIALVFLVLYLIGLVISLIGADYLEVRARIGHPVHATLLSAFIIVNYWHAKLGLDVVIEDYVHTPWRLVALKLLVVFVTALATIASLLAIVRVTLGLLL